MSRDPFTHEAGQFVPAAAPSGVGVSEDEARYAALYSELTWDGAITPDKRHRLRTAAQLFGLSDARAASIEASIAAAPEAEASHATPPGPSDLHSLAPLVGREASVSRESFDELRFVELDARIDALESDNGRLVSDAERLTRDNERLAGLVAQLRAELAVATVKAEAARASRPKLEEPSPRASRPKLEEPSPRASRPKLAAAAKSSASGAKHRSRRRITRVPPAPASLDVPAPSEASPSPASLSPVATRSPSEASPAIPTAPAVPSLATPSVRPAPLRNQPEELHRLLRRSPRDPDLLRALFRSLQRVDDADRRWCIAHALAFLGEANDQERAVHLADADDGLVRPWRAVRDDEWSDALLHPDQDRLLGDLLGEIAPAVLIGQVTTLRASLSTEHLGDAREVDPKLSSEPAVRALAWAAASLGLKLPPVLVGPSTDCAADVVLTPRPAIRLGRRALSGRTPRELAFLAGRHLAWFRKEHVLAQPDASVRRLEDWVLAALRLGNPEIPLTPETRERVEPLAVTIAPLLDEPAFARLQRGYARFVEHGARMNVGRWARAVGWSAACAGLLVANDLGAAASVLEPEGGGDAENTLNELIVYFTSRRCSTLRRRLGIAVEA